MKSNFSRFFTGNILWVFLFILLIVLSFITSSSNVERLAVLFELLCIWFLTKESMWSFPFGMLSTSLFFIIFLEANLYGNMSIQLYFFMMNIIGLYIWKTKKSKTSPIKETKRLSKSGWLIIFTLLVIMPFTLSYFLSSFTNASNSYLDSLLTVMSMIASFLTVRKFLENWYLWILAESLYFILFIQHSLFLAAFMGIITTILNIHGLLNWKKNLENAEQN